MSKLDDQFGIVAKVKPHNAAGVPERFFEIGRAGERERAERVNGAYIHGAVLKRFLQL
jgi:hypothetical protein